MITFQESPAVIGGFSTRVLERAASTDTTLLFVHGWADSADTFKPLMDALADLPARLVAVDLPNFGGAQDLPPGPQLPQYVSFVRAALEHFGQGQRLLPVAQSLGGRALLMALNPPGAGNIPACVVIGPAPLDLPPWQKMLVRNASLAPSASKLGETLSWEDTLDQFLKSFKRTCLAHPQLVPESVYADYLRHYTTARIGRHMESLCAIGAELSQPLQLSQVRCPVQMIWGDLDRMAPVSGAQRYVDALPDITLRVFKDCGHHTHLERVQETAAIVRACLHAATA